MTAAPSNDWLLEHRSNKTSQFGEDGIIAKVLDVIGVQSGGWCVEFGAYDGVFCSNTHSLIHDRGFSAVLIEVNTRRLAKLRDYYRNNGNVRIFDRFVRYEGPDSLDRILGETPIPVDFDVLSIDVDGNDYHLWASVTAYRPKVVVIEFNPTIPPHVHVVQPKEKDHDSGASIFALAQLGKEKGYELVSATDANAIFVEARFFDRFGIVDNSPATLVREFNAKYISYLYQKFDGTLVLVGNDRLIWHRMRIDPRRLQMLPRFLRFYPGRDSLALRTIKLAYYKLVRPDLPTDHL